MRADYTGILENWVEVHDLTLSLDTNAYAQHDVLADRQEVANVTPIDGGTVLLQSVLLLDLDDNARAITLILLDADVTIGTENAAVSISDANAAQILGRVVIEADDYEDMVGSQFALITNIGLPLKCASADTSIWVAAVYRDATGDTYTASGIKLKLGVLVGM